jgi:hypothetical protein
MSKYIEIEMAHLENFILDWENYQSVRVNLSSSFIAKSRCKFCATGPQNYFISKLVTKWYDHSFIKERAAAYLKRLRRMNFDFYLDSSPKHFKSVKFLIHTVFYKGYDPVLHKNRGVPAVANYMEYLACHCGRTQWAFVQKSAAARPEIIQRKSRNKYPRQFGYRY